MGLAEWLVVGLGTWVIVAVPVGLAIGTLISHRTRQIARQERDHAAHSEPEG